MAGSLSLYVAATRQNDGKTTAALGLVGALGESFPRVGYIKPVGQQVKLIGDRQIDKDASLIKDVFQIGSPLQDMSPVAIPRGFTEEYILEGDVHSLPEKILAAYRRELGVSDFIVIEGTGHAGVGSVLDLSNAAVARMLGVPVVIVTCAGIGRPIDEVMLNKALFDSHGVDVLGVIVNKVMPEKFDKVNRLVRLGLEKKGIRTFGVVPFVPLLSSPTLRQLAEDIKGELVSGDEGALDHIVSRILVGAMPAHEAFSYFKGDVLLITPGNREDLILAALASNIPAVQEHYAVKGLILTCGVRPNPTVLKVLRQTGTPAFLVADDTFTTAQKMTNLIVKIRPEDDQKIETVKRVIKEHVDVAGILESLRAARTRRPRGQDR
ncbi:MAG: AAA family ATPase [Spirochaetales bacterium]|nr:AAA family ATPase [Spirochaetales bacterium]